MPPTAAATSVTTFVDAWVPEFVKSIAMFTGTALTREDRTGVPTPDTLLWHEQVFTLGASGKVWIGLPEREGLTLVESSADSRDDRIALLREAVDQSLKAAAQVLGTSGFQGLSCADASTASAPAASASGSKTVIFKQADGKSLLCTLRFDREFDALFAPAKPAARPAETAEGEPAAFERFVGVDLPVSVVLGRATLRVRDVLKLTTGSLIELDTRTTDPVDICVNDTVVARGEVVSIRGNYGVRITEVMSQRERMNLEFAHRHTSGMRAHQLH